MMGSHSVSNFSFLLIAIVAGALVPFQAGSNAALGKMLGHPLWATLVSLTVSVVIVLMVSSILRIPKPEIAGLTHLPIWVWFGGIAGVIYITCALMLTPKLGATSFIVCVIAGQLIASLAIDYFGLMGLVEKEINFGRIAGVAMVFLGSLTVQWFSQK